jgi:TRAP-type uncharacterized transport system substrate-binding protein
MSRLSRSVSAPAGPPDDDATNIRIPAISNRRQLWLFALLTVLLTLATVYAARVWFRNTSTITFAVGADSGVEARFAAKLSAALAASGSSLRLKIVNAGDSDKALAQFDRRQADLAILRTDVKIPSRARTVAILDREVVLLLSPKNRKIANIAALKGKKIAVIGDDRDAAVLRRLLETYDLTSAKTTLTTLPAGTQLNPMLASGEYGAVVVIDHLSRLARDKSFERALKTAPGFTLNEIGEAKAIARKMPGITEQTIDPGLLSASPRVPDEETGTIGLQWLLVAQSTLSEQKGAELARAVLENKGDLALPDGFASQIEPADTDKDAMVAAHRGAAQYIDDDTRTFADRYGDLLYVGVAALGVIGSLFAGLYTAVTRVAPEKAGALATALLDVGEKIEEARSLEALEAAQDELETILRQVVLGLRDGTISGEGLDTFRLGYDFVRDSLELRRDALARRPGREDHVMVVTKAAS